MKKGDPIRIVLHGHAEDCPQDCGCGGVYKVAGRIVDVLHDGFIRAEITDEDHPLAFVDDKKRILTCSPEMYEVTS